jgi:hypothetical protein
VAEPDAYLVMHPPRRSQYRHPRRQRLSGVIVVHTAENSPDTVATDGGAEAVARFIAGRSDVGSYHDLADSDSWLHLVRWDDEAFHDGTGSNPHSLSVSGATRADYWPWAPPEWRLRCITNMALAARAQAAHVLERTGIVVPARRITREQSEARVPGFISHAERDPKRRTDPGFRDDEWALFLTVYGYPEGDEMATAAVLSAMDLVDRTYRTERSANRVRTARREGKAVPATHERQDAPDYPGLLHYTNALVAAPDAEAAVPIWLELVGNLRKEAP